jgi:hypothetical protein
MSVILSSSRVPSSVHSSFFLLQGLKEPGRSVKAWQRALDTLPKENLTAGELKQREQYTAALNAAKGRVAKPETPDVLVWEGGKGKMPWDLAQKERVHLDLSSLEGRSSSVSTVFAGLP